jgi:hypothetical protein
MSKNFSRRLQVFVRQAGLLTNWGQCVDSLWRDIRIVRTLTLNGRTVRAGSHRFVD